MAEIRNNFIKSKMNKDLDARLVPSGEYRDALNVAVSKSEGDDVGALENILGNLSLTDFGLSGTSNLDIIGTFMDLANDRIFVFMTNYVDTSPDKLSNFASSNATCNIAVFNTNTETYSILVNGYFLNFSKTHSVLGVNVIDDLLFWTDNRNQPRKININSALANSSYYTNEDQISVSKYYPYSPIDLYRIEGSLAALAVGSGYTAPSFDVQTSGGTGTGMTVDITTTGGGGATINNPGYGYTTGDTIEITPDGHVGTVAEYTLTLTAASTMKDVTSQFLPDGTTANPYYDANWPGDPDFLQDKFVRFSYRFKFDDDEYSLIAPFTQECFVPQQDGYFIDVDEKKTYESTEVEFMQNKVNDIILVINKPAENTVWNTVEDNLKVKEIEIIYKQSNESSIKILDTIPASDFTNNPQLFYNYQSRKPWKTLPSADLLRVYDQVPVRALAQEIAGNRVIYGNYVDKHTPPHFLNYNVSSGFKEVENPASAAVEDSYTIKEYQNHTLKQNRTYQVGVVLSDRYGRQSDVILSSIDENSSSATLKGSTILHQYKTGLNPYQRTGVSAANSFSFTTSTTATSGLYYTDNTWPGDSLKITFNNIINSVKNTSTGTPGLYSATNPLGWYSYKIVVKQTETDYYNVYTPGILNGYIDGDSDDPLGAKRAEPVAHFALHGDNINKIPRDLSLLGPTQTVFRTGRPTYEEDPSYYEFINADGILFAADPYTEEGERLLKTRDRKRDLDAGSQINNASMKLYPRVVNYTTSGTTQNSGQYYPLATAAPANRSRTLDDVVVTIGTGAELSLWDPSARSPYNIAPVFYGYLNNPYIAKIIIGSALTTSEIDGYGQPGPSTDAGQLTYTITTIVAGGNGYVEGSKNLSTEPVAGSSSSGTAGENGTGVLVNLDSLGAGGTPAGSAITAVGTNVSNEDGEGIRGFENTTYPYTVDIKVLAGDNTGVVEMTVDKRTWGSDGNLSPILAVYETEPIQSKLDIYWESSTSGLISTLNTNIQANDTTTPTSLIPASGSGLSGITFSIAESSALNQNCTDTVGFQAADPAGTALLPASGSVIMELDSVLDGYGIERKSDFELFMVSADTYRIRNASYLYYGIDASTRESYSFFIKVTAPSPDYGTDGSTVTEILELSRATGTPCRLSNSYPAINPVVNNCGDSISVSGVDDGDQLVDTFEAVNGANTNDSRKTNDLTFTITQNSADDAYFLVPVPSEPWKTQLYIRGGSVTTGGSSIIRIRVTDAGGLKASCSLSVDPTP